MIIIGITGTLGAGKGTLVNYLVNKYGYIHLSVRNYLTEKIIKRGLEINRDSMLLIANELREKYGPGYIAQELYQQAQALDQNVVIENIRTPGEIVTLRSKGPCLIRAIDADSSIRYQRILQRKSETDNISYPTFLTHEAREMQSNDPNKQNVKACIAVADHLFINNNSLEELHQEVDKVGSPQKLLGRGIGR